MSEIFLLANQNALVWHGKTGMCPPLKLTSDKYENRYAAFLSWPTSREAWEPAWPLLQKQNLVSQLPANYWHFCNNDNSQIKGERLLIKWRPVGDWDNCKVKQTSENFDQTVLGKGAEMQLLPPCVCKQKSSFNTFFILQDNWNHQKDWHFEDLQNLNSFRVAIAEMKSH